MQNKNLLETFKNYPVDSENQFLQESIIIQDLIIAKRLNAKFTKVFNHFEPQMVEYIKGLYAGEWETYEMILSYTDQGIDINKHLMIYLIDNTEDSCKVIIEYRYLTKRDDKLVYNLFDRTYDNSKLIELSGSFEDNFINFEILSNCNIEGLKELEKLENIEIGRSLELSEMKECGLYKENSEYKRNVLYLDSRFVAKEDWVKEKKKYKELVVNDDHDTYKPFSLFNYSYNNITELNTDLIWLMANDENHTIKMLNHRQANGYGLVLELDPYFIRRAKHLDNDLFAEDFFDSDFEITPICIKQLGLYSDWYGIWKCSVDGEYVTIKEPICVFQYTRFTWYRDSLDNGLARCLFFYNKEPKKGKAEYYSANDKYFPFEKLMEEDCYSDIKSFLTILSQSLQKLQPSKQYPFPNDLKAKTFSLKDFI